MDWYVIVTSVATSAAVSGSLTFLLKTYFKTRIEHYYRMEFERCKAQLSLQLDEGQGFTSRRLVGYPAIVETIYRTRNMARDVAATLSPANLSLVSELAARSKELEDLLYKYRIDLERDDFFDGVHRYKTVLLNFTMRAADVKYFLDHEEPERAHRSQQELQQICAQIEELYERIVHSLSLGGSPVASEG